MISRVQKWGNSLAVRIPKAFADEMKLAENSSIHLMLEEGALVITPEETTDWKLADLLSRVTDENIHEEWDIGRPSGKEHW